MSRPGSLMFAKKLKPNARTGFENTYKGHAMVLLLGHLANGAPLPTRNQFMALVHNAGAVMFDDVMEFLGEEQLNKLMTGISNKYEAKDALKVQEKSVMPEGAPDPGLLIVAASTEAQP